MQDFARSGYQLRYARREVKLVYTGFLVFMALGFCTNGLFQLVRIGPTVHSIAVYYRGGDLGQSMGFPKTFAQLLELTHFHTFVMGIGFLILSHLMIATPPARRLKILFMGLAFAGSLGDVASYWLIRYHSPGWALLQLGSWGGMWLGYGSMIVIPLWAMWSGARPT